MEKTKNELLIENFDFINEKKFVFLNREKNSKAQTYRRSYLKKGDYYYSVFDNKIILLQIIDVGSRYASEVSFKMIDNEQLLLTLSESKLLLNGKNELSLYNDSNNAITNIDSIFLPEVKISDVNLYEGIIYADANLGIFEQQYINEKVCTVNSFLNEQDTIVGKEVTFFFEPYFVIGVDEETVEKHYGIKQSVNLFFRKVKDNCFGCKQAFSVSNNLLVDVENLSCSYGTPYMFFEDIDTKYTNSSNKTYDLKVLVKKISNILSSHDRCWSLKNIQQSVFNPFFQKEIPDEEKIIGFSTNEIKSILDTYFIFDVTIGFYYSFDTWIEENGYYLTVDKKWFNIFYNAIRKGKFNNNYKISDIEVSKKDNEYFRKFTLLKEDIKYYIDLAQSIKDFETFFNECIKRVVNN